MTESNTKSQYTVVLRGPSAVFLADGEIFTIDNLPSSSGPVTAKYRTRWVKNPDGVLIPGHLWVEVTGIGTSLADSIVPFANAGLVALAPISLTNNAAIADPEIELAFDSTPGVTVRDYFQSFVAQEQPILRQVRRIRIPLTCAVLSSLDRNADSERILRAANQYRLALDSWKVGLDTLCVSHLWMAIEALTKAFIRTEGDRRGCTKPVDLAHDLGVDIKVLDPTIRKDFILLGDTDCYEHAKRVSDGFQHGFLPLDEAYKRASSIRVRLAALVRAAIFKLLNMEPSISEELTNGPLDRPKGHWPIAKYLRGQLLGSSDTLAADGQEYPYMRWNPNLTSCQLREYNLDIQTNDTFTAILGTGITYRPQSIEVWEPG